MASWRELCLHEDVEKLILAQVQSCELSARMLAGVQKELVSRKEAGVGRVGEVAIEFIKKSGFEVQLKNVVYHELQRLYHSQKSLPLLPSPLLCAEPLEYLRLAQEELERRLRRKINTLATQIGVPLAIERSEGERQWIKKRWSGLGAADFSGTKELHSIYTSNDLLDVLVTVHNPNVVRNEDTSTLGRCRLMKRTIYSVLGLGALQIETALRDHGDTAYNDRVYKVLELGLSALAREVCKRGCPTSSRRQLWSMAIGMDTSQDRHVINFEKLKSSVFHTHILLERLLVKEVKETTANDDNYFVFEDTILQVLFAFLHDYGILDHLNSINITPMKANIPGDTVDSQIIVAYPPSGIIPPAGISFFVAPLCYVCDRPEHVYVMFKQLYLRYFIHLSCISSHPQGIVELCGLFESLLHTRQPDLFLHLTAIDAPPLRLVFPWLVTAFASQLNCRELLLLWDRVVGFDSLDIIAVFAVAVLEFRALNLFRATCLSEAEAILPDLRCLEVLPLLHQTLFL